MLVTLVSAVGGALRDPVTMRCRLGKGVEFFRCLRQRRSASAATLAAVSPAES